MQFLRRLFLNPPHQRYNATGWRGKLSVHSVPANYEKPLSVPCHEGVQKAVFDHMFDYRQTWSVRKQWR